MLLAFETATREASLAMLADDGTVLASVDLPGRDTAGTLAPGVAALLADLGSPTGYAFDVGPGSFTGLRVGLAFLKGLARGRPAPVAAVGSLEALAAELLGPDTPRVLVALPASGGKVFAALYRRGHDGPVLEPSLPVALHPPAHAAAIARLAEPAVGGGQGIHAVLAADPKLTLRTVPEVRVPAARTVGRLGQARLAAGEGVPASALEPAYHQLSAAEEKLADPGR